MSAFCRAVALARRVRALLRSRCCASAVAGCSASPPVSAIQSARRPRPAMVAPQPQAPTGRVARASRCRRAQSAPAAATAALPAAVRRRRTAACGRGMASAPPSPGAAPMPSAEVTGSVPRRSAGADAGTGAGTAAPPITWRRARPSRRISRRHGVPASAIMQANNISHAGADPAGPAAGHSALRHAPAQRCRRRASPRRKPVAGPRPASGRQRVHVVAPGETLYRHRAPLSACR